MQTAARHSAENPGPSPRPIEIVLPIDGMTCASCVNRVERFLRRTPGVEEATVNLATERATVRFDPALAGRDDLARAVQAAGYDVRAAPAAAASGGLLAGLASDDEGRGRTERALLTRAAVAIAT